MPYISEAQKAMLIAAWKKNELEKRLAWLSPTYTQWNPKLPWGTDYEVLTEQPPGTPIDTSNARLEPWRRWNWVTDGTPNKWLNVPYEYPWNMAAGQYSGLSPFYTSLPQTGESTPGSSRGDTRLAVATMDLAVWNPSAYEYRPAPPKEMVEDDDTYKFWTEKIIHAELEEVTLIYHGKCVYGFPGSPTYYEVPFARPYVETRIKGITYDALGYPIWPTQVNPRTGLLEEIRGTLITWGREITATRKGEYNPHQKVVFHGGRIATSVVRWNVEDEWFEDDNRYEQPRYFQDCFIETVPQVTVTCEISIQGPPPVYVKTSQVEGRRKTWTTKNYEIPLGEKERWEVTYTKEFKYSAYQKKNPYPCYQKPPQSNNRSNWFVRRAVLVPVEDTVSLTQIKNVDARPEALGLGYPEPTEGVEFDDAPNTWYQRWRFKPSQNWADGWGIRCESGNFYDYPEYRVGKIYKDAAAIGEAEKDPVTGNYNAWFWPGMHKELYPMFYPGSYVGSAVRGDGGLPNTPRPTPQEGETTYEYEERTSTYIPEYTSPWRYGNWFSMPVHHYSANDLYTTLFKQKGVTPDYTNPSSIRSALSSISIPGQPGILTPPAMPTTQMLDTTFIFNKLALVPTDFVHAAGTPLPVKVTGNDATVVVVSTPEVGADVARFKYTDNDEEIENPDYQFGGSGGEKIEVEIQGGLLRWDGSAGVAPITNLRTTPLPTVRPDWATLANYPTGWEIHPKHYSTHQARLIGETEMNHRCESIPNWLDTDGGLLFYYADGPVAVNEATVTRRTYFYFMRQARLPSYHSTHQGPINIKLEMFFRKRTQTYTHSDTKRQTTTKVEYDVERYDVTIDFPEGQSLDPTFDKTYTQKDTDPGRSEPDPSKTPNRWGPESSLPTYEFYVPNKNGDSIKIGSVQDVRSWQSFGPYSQIVTSVETYKVETSNKSQGKVYSYVYTDNRYIPNPNPPNPPIYADPNPANWGHWENIPTEYVYLGSIMDTTVTTTLTLLDVKIVGIHGPVYRAYGSSGPQP